MAAPVSIIQGPAKVTGFQPSIEGADRLPVQVIPPSTFRAGFSAVVASGLDTTPFRIIQTGSGQTVSQGSSNLNIATGTTANSETIIRSQQSFVGDFVARWASFISQRITNQNFIVEMVDVLGDGLAYTNNSATSITVTVPQTSAAFTFPAFYVSNPGALVGQSMYLGAIAGSTGIPGRYPISAAAVSGANINITFTVASFAASGSGTLTLFGWNYSHVIYNGTTATQALYDTQRNGWNSLGDTAATVVTSASPGHIGLLTQSNGESSFSDQATTSATTQEVTRRATRIQKSPDDTTQLWLQIRVLNGSSAPGSTTTWSLGFVHVELYTRQNVTIAGVDPHPANGAVPIDGGNQNAVTVGGSLTSAGTVTASTPAAGSEYNLTSAASTNAAAIKASAGNLFELTISNPTSTAAFVKLYNKASAPTVGTDVPVMTIPIAATANTAGLDFKSFEFGALGKRFATGIAIAITGSAAASDSTATVAGIQIKATYN